MAYCTFLEGEQAEAYKKRKATEKEKQNKEYNKYLSDNRRGKEVGFGNFEKTNNPNNYKN